MKKDASIERFYEIGLNEFSKDPRATSKYRNAVNKRHGQIIFRRLMIGKGMAHVLRSFISDAASSKISLDDEKRELSILSYANEKHADELFNNLPFSRSLLDAVTSFTIKPKPRIEAIIQQVLSSEQAALAANDESGVSQGVVEVDDYVKSNGTQVEAHTRRLPLITP